MKKIILTAAASLILFGACSSGNPTDESIEIMKEYTIKIDNSRSASEAEGYINEMTDRLKKLEKENPDFKPSKEDQEKMKPVALELGMAMMRATSRSIQAAEE